MDTSLPLGERMSAHKKGMTLAGGILCLLIGSITWLWFGSERRQGWLIADTSGRMIVNVLPTPGLLLTSIVA